MTSVRNESYDPADAPSKEASVMDKYSSGTTTDESSAIGSEKETETPSGRKQETRSSETLQSPPTSSTSTTSDEPGSTAEPAQPSSHIQERETSPMNNKSVAEQETPPVVKYNTFPTDPELGGAKDDTKMPMPESNPSHEPDEAAMDSRGDRISFSDMGIPRAPRLEEGLTGKARKFNDIPRLEKLYALAMLCAIVTLVSFTIYRLTQVDENDADFVFGLVLLVNSVFCSFYVVDAVKRERPSELFVLSVATVLMVIYLVVNYIFGQQTNVKLARMVVGIVLSVPLVLFGLKTAYDYYVSRSLIFRTVGANSLLQTLLQRLYFFQDLLKFDMELGVSMVILVLTSRLSLDTKDVIILSVGGVLTVFWFFFGYITFKKEYKICLLFFPLGLPEIGYIIYKMYDVSHYIDSKGGLAGATIACGSVALVVRVIVLISGFFVYRGFGNGLKDKVSASLLHLGIAVLVDMNGSGKIISPLPSRMSAA